MNLPDPPCPSDDPRIDSMWDDEEDEPEDESFLEPEDDEPLEDDFMQVETKDHPID